MAACSLSKMAATMNYSFWTVANPTALVCAILLLLLLLVPPVLLLRFGIRRRRLRADDSLPPSPWRLPIIGNLHQLSAPIHLGLHALSLKYGPIILMQLGSLSVCAVSSGYLATQVTRTHDPSLFSGRTKTKTSRILFSGGDGLIFSPENKLWRLTRKLCVSELLSHKNVQSIAYIREEEVGRLVTVIRSECLSSQNHQEIDLSNLFLELATSVVSRSVLGQNISSGCEDDRGGGGGGSEVIKGKLALQTIYAMTDFFSFEDVLPCLSWLDHLTGLTGRLKKTSQAVHAFLDQVIDERETIIQSAGINNGGGSGDDKKYFVDTILKLQRMGMIGPDFTRGNIRALLLDMFVAGITTSAETMVWTMTELARNPRVMKKVQKEVRSVVGSKSEIQVHDIDRMEYLKCVIKEALRLHGLTVIGRQTSSTATVGGFKVPPKVSAIVNVWAIHRDPAAWDRPLEFLPERFLNSTYDFKGQDQVYFPFGMGRRICPGVDFAMAEVEYALANVLCWFDWELPDGMAAEDIDMRSSASVVNHKMIPLCLVPVPMAS